MSNEQKQDILNRFDGDDVVGNGQTMSQAEKLVMTCKILAKEGHAEGLAGQITARSEGTADRFSTLRLGVGFAEMSVSDVCSIDSNLKVVGSEHQTNPALRFHMWVYEAKPDVQALIHTHPPYISALSMTNQPLRIAHMDTAMFYEDCAHLPEWPGVPFSDDEGRIISGALGEKKSILLAHHGLLTTGNSIEEATYLAVYLERAARLQLLASAAGPIIDIPADVAREAHDFLLKPSVVNATFDCWARRFIA